jgi:hypothetical protein
MSSFSKPSGSSVRALAALFFVATSTAALAQTAGPPPPEASLDYTVKPGDKLIRLSTDLLRTPNDWPEVARYNRLKNSNALSVGQVIAVPLRLLKRVTADAKMVAIHGDVQIAGSRAALGQAVPEGARLQTGANSSAVFELADGSRVTMLPNTLAELATSHGYAMRDSASGQTSNWFTGLLRLFQGSLDTAAAKLANRATPLQIQTPTSLVGVRGTQFRVAYDGPTTQNARTEVIEGRVQADNVAQGSAAAIDKGKGAVLNPTVREIKVVDLLPPPDLSALPAQAYKPAARWAMPTLAGAVAFRVQVSPTDSFDQIVQDQLVTSGSADFAGLADGAWFARVRGIDPAGLEGFDSLKPVQIAMALPRAWRIGSDLIEIAGGEQRLSFVPQGLDASHRLTAQVSREGTGAGPVAQVEASGDADMVRIDLGSLDPDSAYLLRITVVQTGGAEVLPMTYRFRSLAGSGWVRDTLELVRP